MNAILLKFPSYDFNYNGGNFINEFDFRSMKKEWLKSKPFNHIVLDNFLEEHVLDQVVKEFPDYSDNKWYEYDNPLEVKKAMNSWDKFGVQTYRLFDFLNSRNFIEGIESLVGCPLYPDYGLNGGGLHTHRPGGKLNTHLDYSMHPKLPLERRVNLIIYITPDWHDAWGGKLGFWSHNKKTRSPGKLVESISPKFNRAVLFDTSQNSWHGLPEPVKSPPGICRNSLAIYYLCDPREAVDPRAKALFSPTEEQRFDPEIKELIIRRSGLNSAESVYGSSKKSG